VINRAADPRTADRIGYELLRTAPGGEPQVVGLAMFQHGRSWVEAPEDVAVPVRELLERAYVDRVQADERPRGYRRSRAAGVDFLVPGMAEHFIARLRGLWLPYPDGSVVTAREAGPLTERPPASTFLPEAVEAAPPVTDPAIRRATLAASEESPGGRPLVRAHPPAPGVRATNEVIGSGRTDCGWPV
jgi:hypothetical protein